MKKLLIAVALTTPMWALATCGKHTEVPKVPQEFNEIWQQGVSQLPTVPQVAPVAPQVQQADPAPPAHRVVKPRAPVYHKVYKPLPVPPQTPEEPVEIMPQTLPCIFPFSLVPFCKADTAGRLP
jgi:hypothetical protein